MFATGRVLWIGIAFLMVGSASVWLWTRRNQRPLRDSVGLLIAGLLLTAALTTVVWVVEPMELGRRSKNFLELSTFVPVAILLFYLFNRIGNATGRTRRS